MKKKKIKEEGPSTLAELKSKDPYPEVVEPLDTNANDPKLLIHFKCMPIQSLYLFIGLRMENIYKVNVVKSGNYINYLIK